jgi:transcription antitermination factor NusG
MGNLDDKVAGVLWEQEKRRLAAIATARALCAQRAAIRTVANAVLAERWYAIYTAPRAERKARDDLTRALGLSMYVPLERLHGSRHNHRHHSRLVIERALLPRYIFAKFDISRIDYGRIRESWNVVDIVKMGGIPRFVPTQLVDGLHRREAAGEFDWTVPKPDQPPPFLKDDPVRVLEGPFAGFLGTIAGMRPHDRVAVLVSLFGRSTATELPIDAVEAV